MTPVFLWRSQVGPSLPLTLPFKSIEIYPESKVSINPLRERVCLLLGDFRYVFVVLAGCGDRQRSNHVESTVLLDSLVADSYS